LIRKLGPHIKKYLLKTRTFKYFLKYAPKEESIEHFRNAIETIEEMTNYESDFGALWYIVFTTAGDTPKEERKQKLKKGECKGRKLSE
jgi:hypothetical protein